MKLTCQRDSLLSACLIAQGAVAARTTKPILSNIKAIAQADHLAIMATDLEVGIRYELRGVKVSRAGEAILPINKLVSILRESNDPEITLNAEKDTTSIRTNTGKYELPGGEPSEFPDLPAFDSGTRYHEVTAGVLRSLIRRVAFAAEKRENTRYAVTGVLWEADAGKIRLVATDTKRLAIANGPATIHGEGEGKGHTHLIPLKAISLLEKNLADDNELIRISLKANDALFQTERAMIYTRLVEGKFPPYQQFLPKKVATKIPVATSEFNMRIRQAAITSDEESKRVEFHFEPGKLTLQARGPETGSSEIEMAMPEYEGEKFDIAFDPAYVTDMLRAIDGEPSVTMELTAERDRAIFRLGDQYMYLVVPMIG